MKGKIVSGLLMAALVLTFGSWQAHAADGFTIGGSFDGFGFASRTDDNIGGAVVGNPSAAAFPIRGQALYSELPGQNAVGSAAPVNVGNASPGDRDFGMFASKLTLNAKAAVNDNVELGFRVALYGTGGGNDPVAPAGGFATIVEQGFVDFHTADGDLGLYAGRFEPNIGTSLRAEDNGSPYIGLVKSTLLPSYLTGAVAYFNSGDLGAAFMIYNDLNGVNDQNDLDLGYGLSASYGADGMNARLNVLLSPEQAGTGVDDDHELWVFILNGGFGYETDNLDAYVDLTWRREGWPTDALQSTEAFGVSLGGTFMATEMFGAGLNFEWAHAMDVAPLTTFVGNGTQAFVADGNAVVINPYVVVALADTAAAQLGWNWETQNNNIDGDGLNRMNIHTFYVQFTAELDSGAGSRTAAVVAPN